MNSKNYLEEFTEIAHKLPLAVLRDVDSRIKDWLLSGGKESDEYIGQQLRYAKAVIENNKH